MKNRFLQATIRFLKETHLYNKNDTSQNIILRNAHKLEKHNEHENVIKYIYGHISSINVSNKKITTYDLEKFIFKTLLNKTHQELFDDYLKENDLYDSFYKNLKKQQREINFAHGLRLTIDFSIHWANTPQGHTFWLKKSLQLSTHLIKLLNNLQNE